MTQTFALIKTVVAVVFAVAAAVCIFVAMPYVTPLAVTSLAFSMLPN